MTTNYILHTRKKEDNFGKVEHYLEGFDSFRKAKYFPQIGDEEAREMLKKYAELNQEMIESGKFNNIEIKLTNYKIK